MEIRERAGLLKESRREHVVERPVVDVLHVHVVEDLHRLIRSTSNPIVTFNDDYSRSTAIWCVRTSFRQDSLQRGTHHILQCHRPPVDIRLQSSQERSALVRHSQELR